MDTSQKGDPLSGALDHLHFMRTALQKALTAFAPGSGPVLDPLTGQPLIRLPDGVKPAAVPVAGQSEKAPKNLQRLRRPANNPNRDIECLYEEQVGHPFDIPNELPEEDE